MNYITHLNSFFSLQRRERLLAPTQICIYMGLFQEWNARRFQNPFPLHPETIMAFSGVCSKSTYVKCLNDLHQLGYIIYKKGIGGTDYSQVSIISLHESSQLRKPGDEPGADGRHPGDTQIESTAAFDTTRDAGSASHPPVTINTTLPSAANQSSTNNTPVHHPPATPVQNTSGTISAHKQLPAEDFPDTLPNFSQYNKQFVNNLNSESETHAQDFHLKNQDNGTSAHILPRTAASPDAPPSASASPHAPSSPGANATFGVTPPNTPPNTPSSPIATTPSSHPPLPRSWPSLPPVTTHP